MAVNLRKPAHWDARPGRQSRTRMTRDGAHVYRTVTSLNGRVLVAFVVARVRERGHVDVTHVRMFATGGAA